MLAQEADLSDTGAALEEEMAVWQTIGQTQGDLTVEAIAGALNILPRALNGVAGGEHCHQAEG